jgi:hypothetical protein
MYMVYAPLTMNKRVVTLRFGTSSMCPSSRAHDSLRAHKQITAMDGRKTLCTELLLRKF